MAGAITLNAVRLENVRGFSNGRLPLSNPLLLVGKNNSGKSSVCTILNFIFNADMEVLRGARALSVDEETSILPARETRNRARRITLEVDIADARRHTRFQCRGRVATLRFTIVSRRIRLNLGSPRRGEGSDPSAVALLDELRRDYQVLVVPASRDARAPEFNEAFKETFMAWLTARTQTQPQQGAPKAYRDVNNLRTKVDALAKTLSGEFLQGTRVNDSIRLATAVTPHIDMSFQQILNQLVEATTLSIQTGDHDAHGVAPLEVGSGLQSLLVLALLRQGTSSSKTQLLMVEEPEAHLHPSVQRTLVRDLLSTAGIHTHIVLTTHSALAVSEAKYGQTTIVKDHRFYPPLTVEPQRESINSILMQDRAAEALFADSILLVEVNRPGNVGGSNP